MEVKVFNFSENIVKRTVEEIEGKGINPEEILVIAPSKRFFYYLADRISANSGFAVAPNLTTVGDLLQEILSNTGFTVGNNSELISILTEAIKKSDNFNRLIPEVNFKTYSGTVSSAGRFLKIFGEINKEKIDFDNPEFINELMKKHAGKVYNDFKNHIEILQSIYVNYQELQRSRGIYDPTFLIERVTDKEINEYFNRYKAMILVSPLAMTKFEREIFQHIEDKLTVIIQDTDEYDFSSIRKWPSVKLNSDKKTGSIKKKSREIYHIEEPSKYHQVAKILSIIEKELKEGTPLNEIVVVNIDSTVSDMLFESLTSHGIEVNYSQGLSIKKDPVFHFLNSIKLFFSTKKSRYLLDLIKDPVFSSIINSENIYDIYNSLQEKFRNSSIFLVYDFDSFLFSDYPEMAGVLKELKDIYETTDINIFIEKMWLLIEKINSSKYRDLANIKDVIIDTLFEIYSIGKTVDDKLFNTFVSALSTKNITFTGSYKSGVQILGLLETRGLAFKTVIIPSFNEGIFPSPSDKYIFFNSEIRKTLNLPGLYQQEALEYFYIKRLMDSSYRTYILTLSHESGEYDIPSRYFYLFDNSEIKEIELDYTVPARITEKRKKSTEVEDYYNPELKSTNNEFSRLDIERIKSCNVRYYISSVLKIKEEEILSEDVDRAELGIRVHNVFRELYKSADLTVIDDDTVKYLKNKLNTLLDEHLPENIFYTSEGPILIGMVRQFIHNVLDNDIKRFRDHGYRLEKSFIEKKLVANMGGRYKVYGYIDRVDISPDGKYTLIDYKTGSIKSIKLSRIDFENYNFPEIQLGLYAILLKKNYPKAEIDSLCYYDISKSQALQNYIEDGNERLEEYLIHLENHIVKLIDDLYSIEKLKPTEDLNNCRYCPFKYICRIEEI